MKKISLILLLTISLGSYAQNGLTSTSIEQLTIKEDSLKELSLKMVFDQDDATRLRSDSLFVRTLVRALVIPYSYDFPFDSVNVSKIYPPDSSFRIFTWQISKDAYVYLQKGVIQMRTKDGSLKIFPLHDQSMFEKDPLKIKGDNKRWFGAIYYNIIQKEYQGKKYYTLIGFDDFALSSSKKVVEVLYFENGEPRFGGDFFAYPQPNGGIKYQNRHIIEFKDEVKAFLNYDPNVDLIIVDHLISETGEPEKKATYVPDGDYEAFEWKNGKWMHIDKPFNLDLGDGNAPNTQPLYDEKGNINEKVLIEQSKKNQEKAKKKEEPPTKNKKSGNP